MSPLLCLTQRSLLVPVNRRPTGLPVEDCLTAESAEASAVLPDFETKLTEVTTAPCPRVSHVVLESHPACYMETVHAVV